MLGAVIGDIIGSRFEWNNYKAKDFELFTEENRYTDDSIISIAVADGILNSNNYYQLSNNLIKIFHKYGDKYPVVGYGGKFKQWLKYHYTEPYNSYGNGAAMRVSACGYAAQSINEVKQLSDFVTKITHNHTEGLKGAEATAIAVFLAKAGKTKEEIKNYINDNYYKLNFTLENIRPTYEFDLSCQGTVPQAIESFLESQNYEDAIRNAISIGGDSDTLAAITGGIAQRLDFFNW